MLKLSKMADYAGVIMVQVARQPQGRIHTAASLSELLVLPKTTVAKCLKTLAKHGVLTSQRGVHGGYVLARSPENISVAEVIYALDGPVQVTSCVHGNMGGCQIENTCPMRGGWDTINTTIQQTLQGMSMADMVK